MKRLFYSLILFVSAVTTSYGQGTKITIRAQGDFTAALNGKAAIVDDIPTLKTYVGTPNVVSVRDSLRGGDFKLYPSASSFADDDGTVFHLNDGRWAVRNMTQAQALNFLWFGAIPNANPSTGAGTDNKPAFIKMLAASKILSIKNMYIPSGNYYFSDSIGIKQQVNLYGDGSRGTTFLWFESGKNGLVFHNSQSPAGAGLAGTSDGSEVSHMILEQRSPISVGSGVVEHAVINIHDCSFINWAGAGVLLHASPTVKSPKFGQIRKVMMTDMGKKYTSTPTCAATSTTGSGATFTPVLATKVLRGILTDSGSDYYEPPTVVVGLQGGEITKNNIDTIGYGARATAQMGVDTIYITAGGTGYTLVNTTIAITGSIGGFVSDPAIVDPIIGLDGGIDSINILYRGNGYNAGTGTAVTITDSTGTGATAHAVVGLDGGIDSVVVDEPGEGYSEATVNIDITGSAVRPNGTATPVISGGVVVGAIVNTRGTGYQSSAETHVTITGDGTGATAFATLRVVGTTVYRKGDLYESPPALRFFGGRHNTGHDATGTTALDTTIWRVKRVILNTAGDNYLASNTTLTFTGSATSPAKAMILTWGDLLGNVDRWTIKNSTMDGCGYGIYTEGQDASAGYAEKIRILHSRLWAVRDAGILGNVYQSCLAVANLGPYLAPSGIGLNTIFIGCYSEGGQLPSVGVNPNRLTGGDHGAGIAGSWRTDLVNNPNNLTNGTAQVDILGSTSNEQITLGGDPADGSVMAFGNSALASDNITRTNRLHFYLNPLTGGFSAVYGENPTTLSNRGFNITGPFTAEKFNRSTTQSFCFYADRFKFGNSITNARTLTNNTAMPTSGEYSAGDIIINRSTSTSDRIYGWIRLTNGSNHVLNTDWMELISPTSIATNYIKSQTSSFVHETFKSYTDGSQLANNSGLTALSIPNPGLDIITSGGNGFNAALNIYKSGNSSGLHLASITDGGGNVMAGGWQHTSSTYKPQGTSMSSFNQNAGGFFWLNGTGLTPTVEQSLNTVMTLSNSGRLAIGSQTPAAYLHLPAGLSTAGFAPLKFTAGTLLTTSEAGTMNYDGTAFYLSPSTTRKRIPLFTDGTPGNGEILIGNGTDFTKASITAGSNVSVTPGAGSITIAVTGVSSVSASTITSSSTPAPTGDSRENELYITAQAATATFAAPSGSLTNGNQLLIRVKDDGTSRTLAWDGVYRASSDLPLPGATTISKTMYIKFKYNSTDSKWDLLSVLNNF